MKLTKELFPSLLSNHDTFIFDCDGVLWKGDSIIKNIPQVMKKLRQSKKTILFVSNNSTKSRSDYKNKFNKLDIQSEMNEIYGSSYVSAVYIKSILKLPIDKSVFVIGMKGMTDELDEQNISWIGGQKSIHDVKDLSNVDSITHDPSVGAVLFGMDVDINYSKYAKAFTILDRNRECHFLATNTDLTYPSKTGLYPGTGALLSALTAPLNRDPIVLGKPHKSMMDAIMAKFDIDPSRTIMIGDRLDTDIQFGKTSNLSTLLVFTGVSTQNDLKDSLIQPDYFINSFGDINEWF